MILWRTKRPRTNTKKRCPFHHRRLECKSKKSRDTWSNRQVWPWSTKWSRMKANKLFPRDRTGHSNTLFQQHKGRLHTDITRWSTLKSYWLIFFAAKDEETLYGQKKTRMGADYCSDHELIAKFGLELKKVGKTTRPFKYDLHQIPYDYTVGVTNRFKGFNVTDRVLEELWMEIHNIVQEVVIKAIPEKKNAKMQNDCLRRSYNTWEERRKSKEIYTHLIVCNSMVL